MSVEAGQRTLRTRMSWLAAILLLACAGILPTRTALADVRMAHTVEITGD